MKRAIPTCVFLVAAGLIVASKNSPNGNTLKQNANNEVSAPLPVAYAPSTPEDQHKSQSEAARDKQIQVVVEHMPEKDTWDRASVVLTGLLVIAAVLTLWGVWYQAGKTREATEAARDSIRLQEVGMQQWVVTGQWTQSVKYSPIHQTKYLSIEFELINPTPFPLTLVKIMYEISGQKGTMPLNYLLPPGKGNRYWMQCPMEFERDYYDQYTRSGLPVVIELSIDFTDVLGHLQIQRIARYGIFGPDHLDWKAQG